MFSHGEVEPQNQWRPPHGNGFFVNYYNRDNPATAEAAAGRFGPLFLAKWNHGIKMRKKDLRLGGKSKA